MRRFGRDWRSFRGFIVLSAHFIGIDIHKTVQWGLAMFRPSHLIAILALTWSVLVFAASKTEEEKPPPPPPPLPQIEKLVIEPASLELLNARDERRVLVTGVTAAGQRIDLSSDAEFKIKKEIVTLAAENYFVPKAIGSTEVEIKAGGKKAKLTVSVKNLEQPKIGFVRDVMPVMTRLGCNSGVCHGGQQGKNGFKLSLRGYDADYDYESLVYELGGRRVNRVDPAQSLTLLKPTGSVPHEGKMLFEPGSRYYGVLLRWIQEGAGREADPKPSKAIKLDVIPSTAEIDLPGRSQQIAIIAHYPDGSTRDVTRETDFSVSNKDVARITRGGKLTADRRGETAVLIRYEGNYAVCDVAVMGDRAGFQWAEAGANSSYIDELVQTKLKKMKILPSDLCTDADFIRRVSLDLTGLPPTPDKARAFVESTQATKRDVLVDELIGSPAFVDHWSNKWADLLQCNGKALGDKAVWVYREWIRSSVAQNKPYDKFVKELLTARGSSYKNPETNYFRVLREPGKITEDVSQTFLGTRFNCNKCHDHPFEKWTQNQYYQFGAYFARVAFKKGSLPGEEIVYRNFAGGEVKHPKTEKDVPPKVPFGQARTNAPDEDRREPFIEWMASKENPLFAKSMANRTWSYFFGIGIIEPVDDIRAGNPPSNPELLDALTKSFIDSNFDVRHLMKQIVTSKTYQRSINSHQWNADDHRNFSHAMPRRLSAEQMLDAITVATEVRPRFQGLPEGMRPVELADGLIKGNEFLSLFGRPERGSACECERSSNISLSHALNLVNGATIGDAVNAGGNRFAKLVEKEKDNTKVIEEIYYAILSRPPSAAEIKAVELRPDKRLEDAQDLAWALMNSPAFIFNR